MGEQDNFFKDVGLTVTIKPKNAKEIQKLIDKALDLNEQLKETLQQIDNFKLEP